MSKQLNLIFAFALIAMIGCSKAPKAYNAKTPPPPPVDLNKAVPTEEQFSSKTVLDKTGQPTTIQQILEKPISDVEVEGSFSWDAKVKANSSRPIMYKVGVGGITFDTTLEESADILAKPRMGPDEDGYAYYDEGLYILWRRDVPRTPVGIWVFKNYLGLMNLPAPFKPVSMGYDFSTTKLDGQKDGYATDENGAKKLAQDYYRILEGQNPGYDCIQLQTCFVSWGNDSKKEFSFVIPGKLVWFISKDRFTLYQMILQEPKPSIPYDLDLLAGTLLVPNQSPIGLGQEFETVEKQLNSLLDINPADIKTSVGMDTFARQYGGAAMVYQKTIFDRKAVQPLPTDLMSMIQVWSNFENPIVLGDRTIVVSETASGVDLRLVKTAEVTALQETVDRREIPLQIRMGLQRKNVRPFVEKLQALIVNEMKIAYPQSIVTTRFTGAFQRKTIKEYSAYIVVFNKTTNKGLFVQFEAEEEQGNLTYFTTLKLGGTFNPMDEFIFGNISAPIEKAVGEIEVKSSVTGEVIKQADGSPLMKQDKLPHFTSLSGLSIGDRVDVTDWDLGRAEATVQVSKIKREKNVETGEMEEKVVRALPSMRAGYADRSLIQVAFGSEKETPQEVAYVSFGSISIGVGLTLIKQDAKTRTYRIVSVTSSLNTTKILDLCGQKFVPEFGMSSVKFLEVLAQNPSCGYLPKKDEGGNGRLISVYFPQDRLRIGFDEDEMVSATIYAPNSEVQ